MWPQPASWRRGCLAQGEQLQTKTKSRYQLMDVREVQLVTDCSPSSARIQQSGGSASLTHFPQTIVLINVQALIRVPWTSLGLPLCSHCCCPSHLPHTSRLVSQKRSPAHAGAGPDTKGGGSRQAGSGRCARGGVCRSGGAAGPHAAGDAAAIHIVVASSPCWDAAKCITEFYCKIITKFCSPAASTDSPCHC